MALQLLQQMNMFLSEQQRLMGADQHKSIMEAQCKNLLQALKSQRMTLEESTHFCSEVASGLWTQHQRELLGKGVAECTGAPESRPGKRQNQELNNFWSFLSREDKDLLGSDSALQTKLGRLVEVCSRLELMLPSEKTSGHIISTLKCLHGGLQDPATFHAALTEFKRLLKIRHKQVPIQTYVRIYPNNVSELPATIQARFASAEGGELDLRQVATTGPLRTSNKTIRKPQAEAQPLQNCETMFNMMKSLMSYHNGDVELPGFRMLQSPGRRSGGPLALPSGSSPTAASPDAAGRFLASPAAAPAATGSTGGHLAVTTSGPDQALQNHSAEPLDKGEPPVTPQEQAAAMLQAWGASKKQEDTKTAHGGEDVDGQQQGEKKGRGRGGRSSGGRGRGRGAKAHGGRGQGDGQGEEHRGGRGTSCKGRGNGSAVKKRPAAQHTGTSSVERSRKKIQAMSKEQRRKLRPRGCAKCRYAPGCSPSCFDPN